MDNSGPGSPSKPSGFQRLGALQKAGLALCVIGILGSLFQYQQNIERNKRADQERLRTRTAIEGVLQNEAIAYHQGIAVRDQRAAGPPPLDAPTSRQVMEQLEKLDTSQCPPEFRTAFVDYVNSWKNVADADQAEDDLRKNLNENVGKNALDWIGGIFKGDPGEVPRRIEEQKQAHRQRCRDAHLAMESLRANIQKEAVAFGAQTTW